MIVRIFRVRVMPGKSEEWQQKVERHSIPWMRQQSGLIAFYPGEPINAGDREFSMTSIWDKVDSIRRAVGEDWQRPVLLADEADIVESVEMHHYQTFG
ncbi:MAG TPA: antibiotic biosynthesis monooxygenase [Xanthobacteraceae bacterium]|nr:antibiotic biosynthesis monooxygenase [Xanthobacteraceae bacterium]